MAKKKAVRKKSTGGDLVGPKAAARLRAENDYYKSLAPSWASEGQTLDQELITESGIKAIRRVQAAQNRKKDEQAAIRREADELGISKKDLPKYRKQIKWAIEQESKPIAKATRPDATERAMAKINEGEDGSPYRPSGGAYTASRNADGSHTPVNLEDLQPTGIKIVRALTGDKPGAITPTIGEFANVIATLETVGASKAARAPAIVKAVSATDRSSEAVAAANAVRKASQAAKAKRAAAAGKSTKAAQAGRAAKNAANRGKGRVKGRYSAPSRRNRRNKRTVNLINKATGSHEVNPGIVPLGVTDTGQALIEGHLDANVKKSAGTTLRAVPGFVAAPFSAAGAVGETAVRATRAGLEELGLPGGGDFSGEEIVGPVKGFVDENVSGIVDLGGELLSGDKARVTDAVENTVGYSFLPLVPRMASSRAVQGAKTGIRTTAKGVRSGLEGSVLDRKTGPSLYRTGPDDDYVFGVNQRRATRKDAAHTFRRPNRLAENEARYRGRQVTKHLPKLKDYNDKDMGMGAGDALAVVVEYGIPRDKTKQAHAIAVARSKLPDESGAPTNTITDSKVFEYLDKHPDLLQEPRFWRMVDAYKAGAEDVSFSERARWMTLGDVGGHLRPEQRTPIAARAFTEAPDRAGAWADLKDMEKEIALLKGEVRAAVKNGDREEAALVRSQVKELQAKRDAFSKILRRYTKPDVKASARVRSILYDRDLVEEYVDEVRAWAKQEGFEEPAWTSQQTARYENAEMGGPRFPAAAVRVQHVRSGEGLANDLLDRSLRGLVSGSIFEPRLRIGAHEAIVRFFNKNRIPINVDGKEKYYVTQREFGKAIEEGQLPAVAGVLGRSGYVWVPDRSFKQGILNLRTKGKELATDAGEMAAEINARTDDPRTKGYIVSREAAKEFADQIDPVSRAMEKFLNGFAKGSSRTLLLLSPGWAISQIIAEALPMLAVINNPIRAAKVAKGLREFNDINEQEARAYASLAGESPIAMAQPSDHRMDLTPGRAEDAALYHKIMSRNPVYRGLLSFNPYGKEPLLGVFDRYRTGKYRKFLMSYHAHKEMNKFMSGMSGLLKENKLLAERLKGKTFPEQLSILVKDEKGAAKIADYLEDVAGNWDTFTRFEREFAPALIFYGFLRYSVRFLWTFPKHHPVRASILYLLSQMNAEQLEKLSGGAPVEWRQWADPVTYDSEGADGSVPIGSRIAPGMNAVTEAIGSGNVVGVLKALNPGLGIPIAGITGINPLSGEKEASGVLDQAIFTLNQILAVPAPFRAMGLEVGGEEESGITTALNDIDPLRAERSFVAPFLPLSASQMKAKNDLLTALEQSANKPEFGEYIKAYLAGNWDLVKQMEENLVVSEAAQDALDVLAPSSPEEEAQVAAAGERFFGITRGANAPAEGQPAAAPSWATSAPSSVPAPATPDTDRPSWAGGQPLTPPGLDPIEGQADRPSWATSP